MSDFAGLWRLDGRPADHHDSVRLAQGLAGRGSADPRIWRQGSFTLVHRQHVFTPEDDRERMPLTGPSGAVLAADIRLSNRGELADTLGLSGNAAALPDGALCLRALERWGTDAVSRFYGDFALALWLPGEHRLVLTRDPSQNRSLFIHRSAHLIAFSTRLRPLLALPEIPRDLDDLAVADHLILNTEPGDRTIYAGINRVRMGHTLTLTPEATRSHRWWSLPHPGTRRFSRYEDTVAAAAEVIDRTVAGSVRAVGMVGASLTGGLDSPTVLLSARRCLEPDRLIALTRIPGGPIPQDGPGRFYDEASRARAFVDHHPGLIWHPVGEDGQDWGESDRRRWFLETGTPADNLINGAWFFPLFRFITAQGGRVILNGEGGNHFYSSHGGTVETALLRQGRLLALTRLLWQRSRRSGQSLPALIRHRLLAPHEPLWLRGRRKGWTTPWGRFAALNPTFAADMNMLDRLDLNRYRVRTGSPHPSVQTTREWFQGDEGVGQWAVAARALHGVDWRAPLGDRRVIEFFASLPLEDFIRDGEPRSLARAVLAGQVPDQTRHETRRGSQLGEWFSILTARRTQMLASLERLKASRTAGQVVDLARLESLLLDWPADLEAAEKRRMEYYFLLTRGLETAEFLAWHEGGNH